MATKFKDGLISGDEISSEGDISTSGSGVKIKANSTSTKHISMHHDEDGGHIDATEQLEIDSPSTIVKADGKSILSGDTTKTTLHHSDDGSTKLTTQDQGITVYGSDGVTAKKFKFPVLEAGAPIAAGSTADTDFALIQAQKIGTAEGSTSVLDFTIGDNPGIDVFRFRFDPSVASDIHSGNEYSLVTIGANTDGCTVMDLTNSHELNADNDAITSEVKAGFFRGKADTVAALTGLTTNNLTEGSGGGSNNLYYTNSRARNAIALDIIDDTDLSDLSGLQQWPTPEGGLIGEIGASFVDKMRIYLNDPSNVAVSFKSWLETNSDDGDMNGDFDADGEITEADYIAAQKLANYGEAADVDAAIITRWKAYIEPALKADTSLPASPSMTWPGPKGTLQYNNSDGTLKYKPADLSRFLTSVPTASSSTLGLIRIGYPESGKNYPVELDTNNKAYVNVPWSDSDTTYNVATSDTAGLIKIGYEKPAGEAKKLYPVQLTVEDLDTGIAGDQAYVEVPWSDTTYDRSSFTLATTDNVEFAIITGEELRSKGDVTAYFSSDRRLKENIVNIPNALDKVNQLNGVTYDWTEAHMKRHGGEDDYFVKKHDTGLIAQEVEQVLPEVVRSREDGYLAIQYDKIVGLLVEAIKELKAEVDELKANK